jgi:hypothetical protein
MGLPTLLERHLKGHAASSGVHHGTGCIHPVGLGRARGYATDIKIEGVPVSGLACGVATKTAVGAVLGRKQRIKISITYTIYALPTFVPDMP